MSLRIGARAALATLLLAGFPSLGSAQSAAPPADARVQAGPLSLAPAIQVRSAGHDSNVYFDADDPVSDFTAVVSPAVSAWFRLPGVLVSGRSEVDAVYYKTLSGLRALDHDHSVRLQVPSHRITPYVAGSRAATRHRRGLEIDAPVRRLDEAWRVGADVRLTGRATVGAALGRAHVTYDGDTFYFGSDLSEVLNRRTETEGVAFKYALTPLTTLGLEVERGRDRFAFTPDRDANSLRVSPVVEFQPFALVSGRAQVGFRRRTYLTGEQPEFRGTFANVDLRYTLLGRTLFAVGVQRDLWYSFRLDDQEYILAGVIASVTHSLAYPWELTGRVGRHALSYRGLAAGGLPPVSERTVNYGVGLGYRLGRTRVGFHVDYYERGSDRGAQRRYERTQISSSLTHAF